MESQDKVMSQHKMQKFFKIIVEPNFLSISKEDSQSIINAEDEWWMNYDSGVPAEDVTEEVNRRIENFVNNKGSYSAHNLV
jgi:hypothetical protein